MKKLIIAAVVALSLQSHTAQAAIVTYNYTGTLGFVYQYFNGPGAHIEHPTTLTIGGSTLSLGDTFHGQFSYDTSTTLAPASEYDWVSNSYKPSTTQFTGVAPHNTATLFFDNKSYAYVAPSNATDSGNSLTVYDNAPYLNDYFLHNTVYNSQHVHTDLGIEFANYNDKTALAGPYAPASLNLNKFPTAFIDFEYVDQNTPDYFYEVLGNINSIQQVAAPVPEPETYAMMLAGIALLCSTARRRRHIAAA